MRKIAILVAVLLAVAMGAYFLFFRNSSPTQPTNSAQTKPKETAKSPTWSSSPAHHPTKLHPEHYSGPTNKYADDYFADPRLHEELELDRQDLSDYISDYDRYNHYDYHNDYQNLYDDYYKSDDYYYDNYYDYAYPQYDWWDWERLKNNLDDPDVTDYLQSEINARKEEKQGRTWDEKNIQNLPPDRLAELQKLVENRLPSDATPKQKNNMMGRVNEATKNTPVEKIQKVNSKLSDPVVKKENNIKQQFLKGKKEEIEKIGPNKERTLDLFQARKGDVKIYVFGTHEKEALKDALPDGLQKKIVGSDVIITDNGNEEIKNLFDANKSQIDFEQRTLERQLTQHKAQKVLISLKATALFGDEGVLKHLTQEGYKLMRFTPDEELLKFEP